VYCRLGHIGLRRGGSNGGFDGDFRMESWDEYRLAKEEEWFPGFET